MNSSFSVFPSNSHSFLHNRTITDDKKENFLLSTRNCFAFLKKIGSEENLFSHFLAKREKKKVKNYSNLGGAACRYQEKAIQRENVHITSYGYE
jgi:hypothetical protein